MTNQCLNHQRSHEFICYQCNSLMCSKCITNHSKDHPDHSDQFEHIDDIKDSLSTLKLDDIIDTTTTTTTNTEKNEIKEHFEQLHQYLIREEHKLQRDIINDKHTITNQIDNNINHLKYALNIINIFYKLNSNISNDTNNDDKNNSISLSCYDQSIIADTTTLYSITTIMESIRSSSSLQSFVNDNNQTLFYDKNNNYFNIDELLEQHSNSSTSLLLDIIYKYNNEFNESTTNTDNNNLTLSSYKLSIKQPDFNQLNSIIEQSIKLDKIGSNESIDTKTTTSNNDNKQSYIFTTPNLLIKQQLESTTVETDITKYLSEIDKLEGYLRAARKMIKCHREKEKEFEAKEEKIAVQEEYIVKLEMRLAEKDERVDSLAKQIKEGKEAQERELNLILTAFSNTGVEFERRLKNSDKKLFLLKKQETDQEN
ncbi:hypothetical protein PPL_04871 [Heterostelium album PN500]|uniref:B box-type domain-containing protein n=1 Tax=Heterostelium pallidum (strain ATCC 26659 / Pp 5 / PN500) TaxID=670386 RepID=D3B8S8_HETP5|nr:hypothetical protein PPL_04871 [Heterostelium album PN500]EFA82446.1 hypothetical protein PPL_04871 [Heterostelium album PN500]|eukprot:XP_020434563.1 hypothetical protein PPL_04871 [Heterostelium album PN500]